MRAMQYPAYATPPVLVDVPKPVPSAGQVLVRVVAASVNPVDWKQASGALRLVMPVKLPCVPGYDLAGVVDSVGPGVTTFTAGTRVHVRLAGTQGGACAQYALTTPHMLVPMPATMDFHTAAGLPLAGMTALQGLRDQLGIPMQGATDRVLVVGASGGVGHLAVQIARAAGAHVTAVCSARNADRVSQLGAHQVVDYARPDGFAGVPPFDAVLDCVADDPSSWLPRLTLTGRYASTVPGPRTLLRVPLNLLGWRRVRPVMLNANATDLAFLDGLFQAGKLRVLVDSRHPLDALGAAWAVSKSGRAVGKILVDVANP